MNLEIYNILIVNFLIFFMGYILGKISNKPNPNIVENNLSHNKLSTNKKNSISIDEKKIVTKIDTTTMEKKYEELGKVTNTSANISSSIDKLKKLKK